jgi:3-oxoadipate enol-lactonase
MPYIKINQCNYYYEEHGTGEETILFSHGLLWSGFLFHKQVDYFKSKYRIITYDHRGQGKSEVTASGYDMETLYSDAAALIEQLKLGPVHFAGLSMGGFVGLRLAARRPDLVRSLILMETSAQPEPHTLKYTFLNTIVKLFGVAVVTGPVMEIMFGETFLRDANRSAERIQFENELKKNSKTIVRAVEGVISRKGVEQELKNITCPVLIMVGNEDKATVPAKAEYMLQHIPDSKLVYIKDAGHSSCIEEPEQVNQAIDAFLKKH